MFPALSPIAAGYKVYAVVDASGDPSELVSRTTLAFGPGWHHPHVDERCRGRVSPHVGSSRGRRSRQVVCLVGT
nr:hypothetical protein [Rhizobium grahamii]